MHHEINTDDHANFHPLSPPQVPMIKEKESQNDAQSITICHLSALTG